MRLGVLDVGSNTVHLQVVDARRGVAPVPTHSTKYPLHLIEDALDDGSLSVLGEKRLIEAVAAASAVAEEHAVDDMLAFATSAVREAPNGDAVLAAVRLRTGVDLQVLTGEDEARLTFLAVRRWHGFGAGRIAMLDIGGGSLEIAAGDHEEPDLVTSLPLGAGRLTRTHVVHDPPTRSELDRLRQAVDAVLDEVRRDHGWNRAPDVAVATSKTFRSLWRLAGSREKNGVRTLTRPDVAEVLRRVSGMSVAEREQLPGVTATRAPQLVAGAVVAEGTMRGLGIDAVVLCPWALREGILLRRLDWLAGV
ncbi:MAG TPA: hypothetical protein VNA14_08395 [Mycobacteriales bacterium]|nr:hypothetical protein [Mycobacteriales bacterium]